MQSKLFLLSGGTQISTANKILFEICITNLLAGETIIPFAWSNIEMIVTEAVCYTVGV